MSADFLQTLLMIMASAAGGVISIYVLRQEKRIDGLEIRLRKLEQMFAAMRARIPALHWRERDEENGEDDD